MAAPELHMDLNGKVKHCRPETETKEANQQNHFMETAHSLRPPCWSPLSHPLLQSSFDVGWVAASKAVHTDTVRPCPSPVRTLGVGVLCNRMTGAVWPCFLIGHCSTEWQTIAEIRCGVSYCICLQWLPLESGDVIVLAWIISNHWRQVYQIEMRQGKGQWGPLDLERIATLNIEH